MTILLITVSPDPFRIVNQAQKRNYYSCTPEEQYRIINAKMRVAVNELLHEIDYDEIISYNYVFEFNQDMNLHIHGHLTIGRCTDDYTEEYVQKMILLFKKIVHRHLGRSDPPSWKKMSTYVNACVDVKLKNRWIEIPECSQYKSWEEYMEKDQTILHKKRFPPVEYSTNTLIYLESLLGLDDPKYRTEKEHGALIRKIDRLKKKYGVESK